MSSDQGKNTEIEQRFPTTEKQKIESNELTDKDLEKVAGGGAQPHMIGSLVTSSALSSTLGMQGEVTLSPKISQIGADMTTGGGSGPVASFQGGIPIGGAG